jgi:hypothetical protein
VTNLKVALLETNAHGQYLMIRYLVSLLPLCLPVRQMSLVESMGGRDFTFSLNSSELGRQRTGNSLEDETTSQGGDKRLKQHDGSLFGVSFARPKERRREGGKSDLLSEIRGSSHSYTNLVPVSF